MELQDVETPITGPLTKRELIYILLNDKQTPIKELETKQCFTALAETP